MISWVKNNKLASFIIAVLLFLLLKNYFLGSVNNFGAPAVRDMTYEVAPSVGLPPVRDSAPTQTPNRLVVQESNLSMVVSNVREVSDKITAEAKRVGGYMVSTSLTSPEEAPFATVVVRLPASKLKNSLDFFRSQAIRVTSENILGTDVTDQYVDLQARLDTLNKTKGKFEEILNKAAAVQDILQVQQQLVFIQEQIDALKGQQQYLEQTAKLAKMTVYLSTDEFSLPYSPSTRFRPEVIFKEAVRSLVGSLRDLAGSLIWIAVYAVVWIPAGLILYLIWKKFFKPVK